MPCLPCVLALGCSSCPTRNRVGLGCVGCPIYDESRLGLPSGSLGMLAGLGGGCPARTESGCACPERPAGLAGLGCEGCAGCAGCSKSRAWGLAGPGPATFEAATIEASGALVAFVDAALRGAFDQASQARAMAAVTRIADQDERLFAEQHLNSISGQVLIVLRPDDWSDDDVRASGAALADNRARLGRVVSGEMTRDELLRWGGRTEVEVTEHREAIEQATEEARREREALQADFCSHVYNMAVAPDLWKDYGCKTGLGGALSWYVLAGIGAAAGAVLGGPALGWKVGAAVGAGVGYAASALADKLIPSWLR